MLTICVLIVSILIQLSAAFVAFRLIKITGKQLSWALIAIAMLLQAWRRAYTLILLFDGEHIASQISVLEGLGLAISILILIGVSGFGLFLKESKKSIGERKFAHEEIRRLNERIGTATQASRMGIWDWDIETNRLVWDDQMFALYGLEEVQFGVACESCVNVLHEADREFVDFN
jgi:PAS domain-containing protein